MNHTSLKTLSVTQFHTECNSMHCVYVPNVLSVLSIIKIIWYLESFMVLFRNEQNRGLCSSRGWWQDARSGPKMFPFYAVPLWLTTKMTELKSRPRVRLIDLLASLPKVAVLILTSFCLISGSELTALPRHLGANKDWPDLVMAIYVSWQLGSGPTLHNHVKLNWGLGLEKSIMTQNRHF